MKFFFKVLLCFLCLGAGPQSGPLILVSYSVENEHVELLIKLLTEKFYIYPDLIEKRRTNNPCEPDKSALLHLCLDEHNGVQAPWKDPQKFSEVLGVFFNEGLDEMPLIDLSEKQIGPKDLGPKSVSK